VQFSVFACTLSILQDNVFDFIKLNKETLIARARSYENSGKASSDLGSIVILHWSFFNGP